MPSNESSTRYFYKLYGLKIESEIVIPKLFTTFVQDRDKSNATIFYGKAPKELEDTIYKNKILQISSNEFLLSIRGVAKYYVTNGNSILVEPEFCSDEEKVKVFLLGTSLGVMLIQRNTVAMHGGTIVVDGKGIIITGHNGVGKSTLISAFRKAGYSFLSDDVSALENTLDKGIIVQPSYPQQKLCKDTMEKMGYNANEFPKVDEYRDKYAIYLEENFSEYPIKLFSIYEINIGSTNKEVEICEVLGAEKIRIIIRNIYRVEVCEYIGFNKNYFKQCINIAKNIRVYKITRPRDTFSVNDQMKLIKDTFNITNDK